VNLNYLLALIFSILALVLLYYVYLSFKPVKGNYSKVDVSIKGQVFQLEIADNAHLRQQGLMNRDSMPQKEGMLFVFPISSIHSFWMKDTHIPLDIIWINSDKKIVYIKENAQPCSNIVGAACQSIFPTSPAKYVIELNAGKVGELGLSVGDQIDFAL